MIKQLLLGATILATATPSFALGAPVISAAVTTISSNVACRNKARSKYFELGARDMSNDTSNAQWATVGNMQAVVWCRDTQAVIAVAGGSFNAVGELRDEISKAF